MFQSSDEHIPVDVYEGSSVLYISSSKAENSIYEKVPLLSKYNKFIKMKTNKNKIIKQTNEWIRGVWGCDVVLEQRSIYACLFLLIFVHLTPSSLNLSSLTAL